MTNNNNNNISICICRKNIKNKIYVLKLLNIRERFLINAILCSQRLHVLL